MEVYVIVSGTDYEGSRNMSVHTDRVKAREAAHAEMRRQRYTGDWLEGVTAKGEATWQNDCDYVTIERHEVI